MVVNNGAAALALAACALAAGREIVIARGELVEIGDGFRIPELLEASGAVLREVGTTNRVRLADYAAAVGETTALVVKVHPSNFVVEGFTSSVPVAELATLPCRSWSTSGRVCWSRTHGCRVSQMPPAPRRQGLLSSRRPATSCWAGRSAVSYWVARTWSSGCGVTRSPAPCAWTS